MKCSKNAEVHDLKSGQSHSLKSGRISTPFVIQNGSQCVFVFNKEDDVRQYIQNSCSFFLSKEDVAEMTRFLKYNYPENEGKQKEERIKENKLLEKIDKSIPKTLDSKLSILAQVVDNQKPLTQAEHDRIHEECNKIEKALENIRSFLGAAARK